MSRGAIQISELFPKYSNLTNGQNDQVASQMNPADAAESAISSITFASNKSPVTGNVMLELILRLLFVPCAFLLMWKEQPMK